MAGLALPAFAAPFLSSPAVMSACSREGAGLGEAIQVLIAMAGLGMLAAMALAGAAGVAVARARGRSRLIGGMLGALLPPLVAGGAVLCVIGVSRLQDSSEQQTQARLEVWLAPLDQMQPGQLRSTLQALQSSAPSLPWARDRLGNELRGRLQRLDIDWSEDDLAAAAEFTPQPWGMPATLAFARHGLADLPAAMQALTGQGEQLTILAELVAERCRADLPRCRERSAEDDWRALRERVGVDVADGYARSETQRQIDWVLHQAFAAPRPDY